MSPDVPRCPRINATTTECEHIELVKHEENFSVGLMNRRDDGDRMLAGQIAEAGGDLNFD